MTVLISILVSDILPIFIVATVGFLLARWLDASVRTLAHISFYALAPCLVFRMLVTSTMTGPPVGRMAIFVILIAATMGLLARLATIPFRLNRAETTAFVLVVMLSNSGNFGLPVVLFAFGTEALSHATVYFVVSATLTYTVGVFVAAAGQRSVGQALLGVIKVPAIYGVAAALLVVTSGITVPVGLMRPIGILSDAAIPIMLLVLGMQLERAKVAERPGVVAAAVVLSLLVAPIVAMGLAWILGLSGPALQAGVLLASMPTAVITTILAVEFNVAPAFVTSVVFLSTLFSPFTLAAIIAYLR